MVKYNLSRYISVIVVLTVSIFLGTAFFRDNLSFSNINTIWDDIATTISIVTFICTLFVTHAWKWKVFQGWLVPFPCLSGMWRGEIKSTYNSEMNSIPVNVTIRHSFFNIQIKIKTGESSSISICGSFDIDEERGLKQLIYSYQNNPKATIREKSEIHYGTTRLEISDNAKTLEGEYWTTRKTTGDVKIEKKLN